MVHGSSTSEATKSMTWLMVHGSWLKQTVNKQKRMTLKTIHQMLDGMSVELAEKVHLLFMAFFRFPPSPLSQEGLHLSLYSLSSGEGKIENFERPSFSKIW